MQTYEPENGKKVNYTTDDVLRQDLPIKFADFPRMFPWPTLSALKILWGERDVNGMSGAFKKFGNKEAIVFPCRLFDLIDKTDAIPIKKKKDYSKKGE